MHTGPVMQSRSRISTLFILSLSLALAAAGCAASSEEPAPTGEGELSIPLTSTAPDGTIYRLANATFEISGPSGLTILDGNPAVPSVSVELPPGLVSILLRPSWTLTRSTDGGVTFTAVNALLGTANPLSARVLADTAQSFAFDFLVRNPNGTIAIRFGVDPSPRQLAGGFRVTSTGAAGSLAPYAGARLDFSTYFSLSSFGRRVEPDGSKTLIYLAGPTATEFYNDPIGILSGVVAPSYTGGYLEYQVTAKTDGTQELRGTYYGASDPYPTWELGPSTMAFPLALDAEGYPVDAFFHELVPYTLSYFDGQESSVTGTLVLRNLLP